MAVKYWTGAVSGNWNAILSWSPAGVPMPGDDVIISGSVDVQPATVAATMGSINVASDYTGSIGESGDPLVVDAERINYHSSGGSAYFDGAYDVLSVRASTSSPLTVDNSTTSAFAYLVRGSVVLEGAFSRVFVAYDTDLHNDVELVMNAAGQIRQVGGYVETSQPSGLVIWDGRCIYDGSFATDPTILQLGGEIDYNGDQPLNQSTTLMAGVLRTSVGNIPTSGTPIRVISGLLATAGDFSSFATSGFLIERYIGGNVTLNGVTIDIGGYEF